MIDTDLDTLNSRPENGCYIRGLYLEGARWDNASHELAESRPKELYTDMPVMWLIPTASRKPPETGVYICPVYKTLTRAGMFLIVQLRSYVYKLYTATLYLHTCTYVTEYAKTGLTCTSNIIIYSTSYALCQICIHIA